MRQLPDWRLSPSNRITKHGSVCDPEWYLVGDKDGNLVAKVWTRQHAELVVAALDAQPEEARRE